MDTFGGSGALALVQGFGDCGMEFGLDGCEDEPDFCWRTCKRFSQSRPGAQPFYPRNFFGREGRLRVSKASGTRADGGSAPTDLRNPISAPKLL